MENTTAADVLDLVESATTNVPEAVINAKADELIMTQRETVLNDVISVIDWLKGHPDIPLPLSIDKLSIYSWDSKKEAAQMAKAFGTCDKSSDDYFFRLTKTFGTAKLEGIFSRNNVCERIVVGTKEVESEEADPVALAQLPKVKTTKTVEIVEWKCPDSLLGE